MPPTCRPCPLLPWKKRTELYRRPRRLALAGALATLIHLPGASAQPTPTARGLWSDVRLSPLVPLTGPIADRLRVSQILDSAAKQGSLLRSPSSFVPGRVDSARSMLVALVPMEIVFVNNSGMPYS